MLRMLRIVLATLVLAQVGSAYSVLSHEAVIDALWDVRLKPILLARYPGATPEELKAAHGYAYGGAIIQDLGYYPHGSPKFSDLTHYVRTGDFILALISDSQDLNEYAFALGALSHYVADLDGHRYATNVSEPILYPKLQKKFGNVITYEDSPVGHLQTEFGFDVLEVAKGNFAPQAYHDFIGFNVSKELIQRAFKDTYGLELSDLFSDFDRSIGSYRRDVSKTIPTATRVAWVMRRSEILHSEPSMTRTRFIYTMSRSSYERNWGKRYDRPTAFDRFLAVLLKLVPPIGPLKALQFKMPTPEVEKLFMESFNRTATQYRGKLDNTRDGTLKLDDENYDVGVDTPAGVYRLKDDTEAFWLNKLASKDFVTVSPSIRSELLTYYKNLKAPIHTKTKKKDWERLQAQLKQLRSQKS